MEQAFHMLLILLCMQWKYLWEALLIEWMRCNRPKTFCFSYGGFSPKGRPYISQWLCSLHPWCRLPPCGLSHPSTPPSAKREESLNLVSWLSNVILNILPYHSAAKHILWAALLLIFRRHSAPLLHWKVCVPHQKIFYKAGWRNCLVFSPSWARDIPSRKWLNQKCRCSGQGV